MRAYWKSFSEYRQNEQYKSRISCQWAKDGFGNKWYWHDQTVSQKKKTQTSHQTK